SQFSTTIIALDPDAMPKIFAFAKELRGYVNDIKVLRLTDDLKYKNKKEAIAAARQLSLFLCTIRL
ncbi:MAG: hypothetical protein VXW00_10970, partial [Candidatus Latescibacterota bacterium]|nr:hypothetical protein [Candidatus Latescibacterota bacterium]